MSEDLLQRIEGLEKSLKILEEKVSRLDRTSDAEAPKIFSEKYYVSAPGAMKFCVEYRAANGVKHREFIYEHSLAAVKQKIQAGGGVFVNGWVSFDSDAEVNIPAAAAREKTPHKPASRVKSEDVLNKIGIGLLFLGVAFFFKYAVDQGWLTPVLRIAAGFLLGAFLVGFGVLKFNKYPKFSRVLQGGGIAVFYVTVYSAYQLYSFFPYPAAFAFMLGITGLGFWLSVRQMNPMLAVISLAGGMGTPFILYSGSQNLPGLIVYSSLFLVSACLIYVYRGWWSLVLSAGAGMWIILLTAFFASIDGKMPGLADKLSLQAGIIYTLLGLGGLAIAKEYFKKYPSRRWGQTPYLTAEEKYFNRSEHMFVISSPFIGLAISESIWNLTDTSWGWIALAIGLVYGGAWKLLKVRGYDISYTHGITGILVGTFGLSQLLHGHSLFCALAAEAVVLHFAGSKYKDRLITAIGHALFIFEGMWLTERLFEYRQAYPVFNAAAVSDIFVVAMIMAASVIVSNPSVRIAYQSFGHFAFLCFFYREFEAMAQGQAYTTVIWGLYAIGILMLGVFKGKNHLRMTGLSIIFIVIGKLFLIDLAAVAAIWRVLLFLGFGSVLLVLSYHLPKLTKPKT